MKKQNFILLLVFLFIVSCSYTIKTKESEKNDLWQDGFYRAEAKYYDSQGWKRVVELRVRNGYITEIYSNYYNRNGELKSEKTSIQNEMKEKIGLYSREIESYLQSRIIETQNVDKVDIIVGATMSSVSFKRYMEKLIDNVVKRNNDIIFMEKIMRII